MVSVKKNNNLAIGDLVLFANNIASAMTRDLADLSSRGVTLSNITAFEAKAEELNNFPTDEYYLAEISLIVEQKLVLKNETIDKIQFISGFFEQKWGLNSPRYKQLGIKNLTNMRDNQFMLTCKRVSQVATDQLTVLSSIGLTQTDIDSLIDMTEDLSELINQVFLKQAEREEKTQERILLCNSLYDDMRKYSTIGKLVYENTDEAKYNDYIIHKTTHEKPLKVQNLSFDSAITKLKWDKATGASNYELEMRRNEPTFDWAVIYSGKENEFIYNPEPGPWLFRCRGVNSNGPGYWSDELSVIIPIT